MAYQLLLRQNRKIFVSNGAARSAVRSLKTGLFFFFSYDQQRRNFPGLATFQSLNFLNTANRTLLTTRGLTNAQIDNTLSFLNSLSGENPRKGDQTLYLPKIDWLINDRNTLSISYNRMRWESPNGVQTQPVVTRGRSNLGRRFCRSWFN